MRVTNKSLLVAFLSLFLSQFLVSCGGDNETSTPQTPITGIGLQNGNLLSPFDPSFESAVGFNGRNGSNQNHFQINSRNRNFNVFDITSISAHTGSKSLRIFEPHTKVLLYPVKQDNRGRFYSPLTIVPNARYKLQMHVKLPRNTTRNTRMRVTTTLRYFSSTNVSRSVFSELVTLESQGVDNNNWENLSVEFTTPFDAQTLRLGIGFGRVEELLLDSISLIRIQ